MDREKTHRKIDELATLISVNNNRMMLHEEKIPQLDIDLLRKNAIELYEAINMLHIQNLKDKRSAMLIEEAPDPEIEETTMVSTPKVETPPVIETIPEPPAKEVEMEEPEVKRTEVPEPEISIPVDKKTDSPATSSKDKSADKRHLYEKLNRSRIESIKKSISISKRYEVQAALFKNDPDAYNEAIGKLDAFDSAESALGYLMTDLKNSYNWNDEDPLVEELYLLVERRYA